MAMRELGEIQEVNIREIWPHEAHDFTTWLAQPDGLALLGSALGLDLELVRQEASVGDFWLDILVRETSDGEFVAVENQLEMTNHDHLGKSITYAAENRVGYVIWIASYFRPEHKKAIDWLNSLAPGKVWFFAVEIHAIQIGDSLPAADFRPVAVPKDWEGGNARTVIPSRPSLASSELYFEFFQSLVDELREAEFTEDTEADPGEYGSETYQLFPTLIESEIPYSEISYNASFENGRTRIYFFGQGEDRDLWQRVYDRLLAEKEQIEAEIGKDLEWKRRRNTYFFHISLWRDAKIDDPPTVLEEIRAWMVEMLPKFRNAFDPRIEKILADLETE